MSAEARRYGNRMNANPRPPLLTNRRELTREVGGLIYNENGLNAPYIFQRQPTLSGLKTLRDLNTTGFGWDGHLDAIWKPHKNWQFGLSYRSPSTVHSTGDASGDVGLQLGAPSVPFHYDAEVVNHFAQTLSIGAAWQAHPRWRVFTQLDWINWQEAFDELQVRLTHGTSAAVNGAVGSDTLEDAVPLRWRDQIVYRTGCEVTLSDQWRLRFGYSYGRRPAA